MLDSLNSHLATMEEELSHLSTSDWATLTNAVKVLFEQKPTSQVADYSIYWDEIYLRENAFDRNGQKLAALEMVTKLEFFIWY